VGAGNGSNIAVAVPAFTSQTSKMGIRRRTRLDVGLQSRGMARRRAPRSTAPNGCHCAAKDSESTGSASRRRRTPQAWQPSSTETARSHARLPIGSPSAIVSMSGARCPPRRSRSRRCRNHFGRGAQRERVTAQMAKVFLDAPQNYATSQRKARRHRSYVGLINQCGQPGDN